MILSRLVDYLTDWDMHITWFVLVAMLIIFLYHVYAETI